MSKDEIKFGEEYTWMSKHLHFIHDRMVNVYGESENVDFLIKLREIIKHNETVENQLMGYIQFKNKKDAQR